MRHVMIDLETMGTFVNAPVLAIGAVFFDPDTGALGDKFYAAIDLADACRYGRPSGETIKWWMGQSDDARKAATAGQYKAEFVFGKFAEFLKNKSSGDVIPWGNGASFDISILEYAFLKVTGDPAPWKFWNIRDCRTIKDLAAGVVPFDGERQSTQHHALDDAVHQAQWVSAYWQGLRAKATPAVKAEAPAMDGLLG